MKITKLGIMQFEGLEALSLQPDDGINLIEGRNGAGKTSILEAIRVAFTNRGQRSMLVHDKEGQGRILFELSDGTIGERNVNNDGRTAGPVTLRQGSGEDIWSAQTFLNKLGLGFGFNPLEFIGLRTDKQTKMLLEVTPVDITLPALLALSGGKRITEVDYRAHPLEVLTSIAVYLEEERRMVGRDARDAEGMAETLFAEVPEGFDAEAVRDFDLSAVSKQLGEIEVIQSRLSDAREVRVKKTARILALQQQVYELEAELAGLNQVDLALSTSLAEYPFPDDLRAGISSYRQQQAVLAKLNEAHASVERAGQYRSHYAELQEMINAVRAKPGELLMNTDLPVSGLGISDTGAVTINGLPIADLSTGEQLKVAVDIAIATLGDLKVILVDGLETLDADNSEYLLSRFTEAGVQAFVTRISDTELTVITGYGDSNTIADITAKEMLSMVDSGDVDASQAAKLLYGSRILTQDEHDKLLLGKWDSSDTVNAGDAAKLLYGGQESLDDSPDDDGVDSISDDELPWDKE